MDDWIDGWKDGQAGRWNDVWVSDRIFFYPFTYTTSAKPDIQ